MDRKSKLNADLVSIREYVREDFKDVHRLDREAFGVHAWKREDLAKYLARADVLTLVAVVGRKVVGAIIVREDPRSARICSIVVQPESRRNGIGQDLVRQAVSYLSYKNCVEFLATVRERNKRAILFLRSLKFFAFRIRWSFFNDPDEDGFEFSLPVNRDPMSKAGRRTSAASHEENTHS